MNYELFFTYIYVLYKGMNQIAINYCIDLTTNHQLLMAILILYYIGCHEYNSFSIKLFN